MPFVLNRPGPGSFSSSWEGKRYVLIAGEAPPPGTPPQVIAKAKVVGLVMAEPGKPAPPLEEATVVGGIKVKPSPPPGAHAEPAQKDAEKQVTTVSEGAAPIAEEESPPLALKGAKPAEKVTPEKSGAGEEQVAQKTKRPRGKSKRAAGDKA